MLGPRIPKRNSPSLTFCLLVSPIPAKTSLFPLSQPQPPSLSSYRETRDWCLLLTIPCCQVYAMPPCHLPQNPPLSSCHWPGPGSCPSSHPALSAFSAADTCTSLHFHKLARHTSPLSSTPSLWLLSPLWTFTVQLLDCVL